MVSVSEPVFTGIAPTNHRDDPPTISDRIRVLANIVLTVAQILASQITATMGVNDIGTRSAQSPALFTPPGFTFAIWGLIFLATIAYAIYQALPRHQTSARLRRIGWWTAAAMGLNAAWELTTVEIGVGFVTVVIIFAMLAALMGAFLSLYRDGTPSRTETAMVVFPISIFAGWITVASIANTSSWLGNAGGFNGGPLSDASWVGILTVVAGIVGALVMRRNRGNIYYALVLVWALGGIIFKGVRLGEMLVIAGASIGLVIVAVGYFAAISRGHKDVAMATR